MFFYRQHIVLALSTGSIKLLESAITQVSIGNLQYWQGGVGALGGKILHTARGPALDSHKLSVYVSPRMGGGGVERNVGKLQQEGIAARGGQ